MVIIANGQGTVTDIIPEHIYQGSNLANEIIFVAPFSSNNNVLIAFNLPNGINLKQALMVKKQLENVEDADGAHYNAWSYMLPASVTEYRGEVTAQFYVVTESGTVATSSMTFTVEKGVPVILPDEPTEDVYTQIIQLIGTKQDSLTAGAGISVNALVNGDTVAIDFTQTLTEDTSKIAPNKVVKDYIDAVDSKKQNNIYSANGTPVNVNLADKLTEANATSDKIPSVKAVKDYVDAGGDFGTDKLDKAAVNSEFVNTADETGNALTFSQTEDADITELNYETYNPVTGDRKEKSAAIPLATDNAAGVMSPSDYRQIRELTSRVESLEGKTTRLLYTAGETPTAEQIQAFVTGLGYTEPFDGIAVVVAGTYHIWHYYSNDNIGWRDDGADTVNQFTNENAGVIKGADTDGKVYAETDGTGSVKGWNELKSTLDSKLDYSQASGYFVDKRGGNITGSLSVDQTLSAATVSAGTVSAGDEINLGGLPVMQLSQGTLKVGDDIVSLTLEGMDNRPNYKGYDGTEKGIALMSDIAELQTDKQDKLTAGTNVSIEDNVISVSGDLTPVWGTITGDIDNQTDLKNAFDGKVNKNGDTMTGNLTVPTINANTVNSSVAVNAAKTVTKEVLLSNPTDTSAVPTVGNQVLTTSATKGVEVGSGVIPLHLKGLNSHPAYSQNGGAARELEFVNYRTCSMSASAPTKDVICPGFVLETGAKITVKFTYGNTVNLPSMNVNNTGGKPIYMAGAGVRNGAWAAGAVVTFVYDGTYWVIDNANNYWSDNNRPTAQLYDSARYTSQTNQTDTVTAYYRSTDGTYWHRFYASGWKKMGGFISPTTSGSTITYSFPMQSFVTAPCITLGIKGDSENNTVVWVKLMSVSSTGFSYRTGYNQGTAATMPFYWEASGY